MSDRGSLDALRPETRALLARARRNPGDDARALVTLREDLEGLSEDELIALWAALAEDAAPEAADGPAEIAYRAVDKARRRLLVPAERFRDMLLEHVAKAGGAPAPGGATGSLKALVAAFAEAGRAQEIEAAATAIVRSRSLAHDIT